MLTHNKEQQHHSICDKKNWNNKINDLENSYKKNGHGCSTDSIKMVCYAAPRKCLIYAKQMRMKIIKYPNYIVFGSLGNVYSLLWIYGCACILFAMIKSRKNGEKESNKIRTAKTSLHLLPCNLSILLRFIENEFKIQAKILFHDNFNNFTMTLNTLIHL